MSNIHSAGSNLSISRSESEHWDSAGWKQPAYNICSLDLEKRNDDHLAVSHTSTSRTDFGWQSRAIEKFSSCKSEEINPLDLANRKTRMYDSSKNKEESFMSFVGISIRNDKIVAFADGKGTIVMENGSMFSNEINRPVKKIFSREEWICVSYGTGEIILRSANFYEKVPLDVWMNKNSRPSPLETADLLRRALEGTGNDNAEVGLIFVYLEDHIPRRVFVNVTKSSIKYDDIAVQFPEVFFGGNNDFVQHFSFCPEPFISGDAKTIRNEMEKVIRWRDSERDAYNPVGLPILIRTWDLSTGKKFDE